MSDHNPQTKPKPKPIITKKYTWDNELLRFTDSFNEPLEPYHGIMSQASRVMFSRIFNGPIILFPNMTYLSIGCYYTFLIVPNRNIRTLCIEGLYQHELKLPSKFETLIMFSYKKHLTVNKNMKTFDIHYYEGNTLHMNKTMDYVTFGGFDGHISTNKRLSELYVGDEFDQPLNLPKHLSVLQIGSFYSGKILLPRSITSIFINCDCMRQFVLECNVLSHIFIHSSDHCLIDNLPDNKTPIELEYELSVTAHNLPKNSYVSGRF